VKRQSELISNIDWIAVTLYLILIVFGWLNIFAVNYNPESGSFFRINQRYILQLAWIFISLFFVLIIFIIDSRFFSFVAYPAYGLGLLLLLIVLIVGTVIHSSRSWIVVGPIRIQPSEFAKIVTIMAIAKYLSGFNFKITKAKHVFTALLLMFFPPLLILLQPDFGSTIVYGALLIVLYREGLPGEILLFLIVLSIIFLLTLIVSQFILLLILLSAAILVYTLIRKQLKMFLIIVLLVGFLTLSFIALLKLDLVPDNKYLILLFITGILCIVAMIYAIRNKLRELIVVVLLLVAAIGFTYSVDYVFHHVMKEHQRHRVNVMLGLESDPFGYEYNLRQSKIAIGSGGFLGKGFMQGTQTKYQFVPEQSTDFIFCTVGEEWGFLGSVGLILVYIGLLVRLIILAERQRSKFGRIYGYGVVSVLFFHFAVNIGMTVGLFPVIGIPLPFLSYGGSSLLAFTIMLFIFIRLDASRKTYLL
jgi:rod shape determining protein RodA